MNYRAIYLPEHVPEATEREIRNDDKDRATRDAASHIARAQYGRIGKENRKALAAKDNGHREEDRSAEETNMTMKDLTQGQDAGRRSPDRQDNGRDFQTGAQLLAQWGCETREAKLERACMALMDALNEIHDENKKQSLASSLTDSNATCSCADAYRMGHEALKQQPQQVVCVQAIDKGHPMIDVRKALEPFAKLAEPWMKVGAGDDLRKLGVEPE